MNVGQTKSLQSRFDQITLHNLLRYLVSHSVTGKMILTNPNTKVKAHVYIEKGRIVHHDMKSEGIAGIEEILSWQQGTFVFEEDVPTPKKDLRLYIDKLLIDEGKDRRYRSDVSTLGVTLRPSSILQTNEDVVSNNKTITLDMFSIELLMQFDGQRSLNDIARDIDKPLQAVMSTARVLVAKSVVNIITRSNIPAATKNVASDSASNPKIIRHGSGQSNPDVRRSAPPRQNPSPMPDNNVSDFLDADILDIDFVTEDNTPVSSSSQSEQKSASNYVDPEFVEAFSQLALEKLGPVASMLIEDLMMDMDTTPSTLTKEQADEIIEEVAENITRSDWQQEFNAVLMELRKRYKA